MPMRPSPSITNALILLAAASLAFATAAFASTSSPVAASESASLPDGDEIVRHLRRYLEIDTSNPPGNEAAGVTFLGEILARHGIEHRRLTSPSGRASLFARLPATVDDPEGALVVTHHIDVVPADPERWRQPPFSGRLKGEIIWGRGAIDVKSLGIAQLVAMVRLAASDSPRKRDLIYLAVADEETGGVEGMKFILDTHPRLFANVAGVLGEGGVNRIIGQQVIWWGIEVEQKRPLWLRLTTRGRGAHGSTPLLDTAPHTLVSALARAVAPPPDLRVVPGARRFLEALAEVEGESTATLLRELDAMLEKPGVPPLPPSWLGVLYDSLQVTRLEAGDSINVISPVARADLDIRLLPDTDQAAYLDALERRLGDAVEVEILLDAPPAAASPTDTDLYRALEQVLGVRGPVVPAMIPGITDSRYFRQRGIPAYGWNPFVLAGGSMRGVHAHDELIERRAFLRGVELVSRLVQSFVAGP